MTTDPENCYVDYFGWDYSQSPRPKLYRDSSCLSVYETTDPSTNERCLAFIDSASVPNNYPYCYHESFRDINEDSSHCAAFKFDENKEAAPLPDLKPCNSYEAAGSGEKSPGLDKKVRVDEERSYVNMMSKKPVQKNKKSNTDKSEDDVRLTQNYIGNICYIFVAALIDEVKNKDSEMYRRLSDCVGFHILKENGLSSIKTEDLVNKVIDYAFQKISGKIDITSKNGKSSRQYKVGSRESITQVFYETKSDQEDLKVIKRTLQSILIYFFNSKDYSHWINKYTKIKCPRKKEFLATNGKKFEQIFLEPRSGRMNFQDL